MAKETKKEPETVDTPPASEKQAEGVIPVPESKMEEMLRQFDNMSKKIAELSQSRDMLLQIADKKQLSIYYQRHRDKLPGIVKLRTFLVVDKDGKETEKVILGWRSTKNIPPRLDPATGRWLPEDQRCELLYEDGTSSGEMYQATFNANYKQVDAEVRQRIIDDVTGNIALKVVRVDNGKEYTIGITFVN